MQTCAFNLTVSSISKNTFFAMKHISGSLGLETVVALGIITSLFFSNISVARSQSPEDTCYVIKIERKNRKHPSHEIKEFYHPDGIILYPNGIYHLNIDGKYHRFQRIQRITKDKIFISFGADMVPPDAYPISAIRGILLYSLNNGEYGLPVIMGKKKYLIETQIDSDCIKIKQSNICRDEACEHPIHGYHYMTAGFGWKPAYLTHGVTYVIDNGLTLEITEKGDIKR